MPSGARGTVRPDPWSATAELRSAFASPPGLPDPFSAHAFRLPAPGTVRDTYPHPQSPPYTRDMPAPEVLTLHGGASAGVLARKRKRERERERDAEAEARRGRRRLIYGQEAEAAGESDTGVAVEHVKTSNSSAEERNWEEHGVV